MPIAIGQKLEFPTPTGTKVLEVKDIDVERSEVIFESRGSFSEYAVDEHGVNVRDENGQFVVSATRPVIAYGRMPISDAQRLNVVA